MYETFFLHLIYYSLAQNDFLNKLMAYDGKYDIKYILNICNRYVCAKIKKKG